MRDWHEVVEPAQREQTFGECVGAAHDSGLLFDYINIAPDPSMANLGDRYFSLLGRQNTPNSLVDAALARAVGSRPYALLGTRAAL